MNRRMIAAVAVAAAGLALGTMSLRAAGETYVTFGADTTEAERAELGQYFGVGPNATVTVVTTPEMVQALQGTGLPAALTDRSISSSRLVCRNAGEGLDVSTANITRITAPVYANALITAGVGDGDVAIAAPATNPVTGETALVGVLRSFPQCQAGRQPDPARVQLAYEQIARTVALAGNRTDLTTASNVLLAAAQPVIIGQARGEAQIGAALDRAAGERGLALNPTERTELIGFLTRMQGLDYGTYARGYRVEQVSPTQVRVVPAGPGTPARQPSPTQAQNQPAVNGAVFDGELRRAGDTLLVNDDGRDRTVSVAPNVIVTRNGEPARLADLRRGDNVTVTTNPDGTAQRIDAESGGGIGSWWPWLLALLLGLLALALLWWLLTRNRRDDFILVPVDPRTTGRTVRRLS
jgi:uncharacterized protein YpuA (DUF1002 family)